MNKKAVRKTRRTHACRAYSGRSAIEASCQKCGRKFVPTRKWQKYCSTECRKLAFLKRLAKIEILNDHEARLRAIEKRLSRIKA